MSSVPTHPEARHSEAGKAPWHRRLVPAPLKRERVGGQAVRFLIVGLSNTAVDLIIFNTSAGNSNQGNLNGSVGTVDANITATGGFPNLSQ